MDSGHPSPVIFRMLSWIYFLYTPFRLTGSAHDSAEITLPNSLFLDDQL